MTHDKGVCPQCSGTGRNRYYDEGWNAFVDGKPYVIGTSDWRTGWLDASEAKATEHMGEPKT